MLPSWVGRCGSLGAACKERETTEDADGVGGTHPLCSGLAQVRVRVLAISSDPGREYSTEASRYRVKRVDCSQRGR